MYGDIDMLKQEGDFPKTVQSLAIIGYHAVELRFLLTETKGPGPNHEKTATI